MSHNSLNYNFGFNNFKELNPPSQNFSHNSLLNRNNKINFDIPKPFSNKTTNNISVNLNQRQLSNNLDNPSVYNTYYSNFQSPAHQIPYKINSLNSNISNNLFVRYNPILNQIGQNNSLGNINNMSFYPIQYNSNINNSISNSISNNMTNATSSSNTTFSNQYLNNNEKYFNNASYSQNSFFRNNFDRRNYSSYDSQSRDNERRKKEEYSLVLKQQIEEKKRRNLLEKQKQAEEDLKYEKKYQEYLLKQEEKNLRKNNKNINNISYNIRNINIPKKNYNTNNINNLGNNTEYITDFHNKNNNSIYFNTNNNMNLNQKINSINNKAININNNNINFFMLDRNQKRPITSSIAQTGLGIIGNINNASKPIQLKNDKLNFPFISHRNNIMNNKEQNRNQKKGHIRANSYNLKKSRDTKKKFDEYSNIYSIVDKVNFKGISYRSKYENEIDDKDNKDKDNYMNNKEFEENQLKNKSKLVVSKINNNEEKNNNKSRQVKDNDNKNNDYKNNEIIIDKQKEKLDNKIIKNENGEKNNTIDIEKIQKKENIINETKNENKIISKQKIIDNKENNKDNNIDNDDIDNNNNKDNEINYEILNKCYYKEENSFLDFDNFSEINKSSSSLKNTDKKQEKIELKILEENTNKKELPDKILNKSLQKNQDNYDDICNIRYHEEEENKYIKNDNDNENIKESFKLSENEINKRLNFFDESSTLSKKGKEKNNKKEEEDDLVQEKPDDYSNENINLKDEFNINENINSKEKENENKKKLEEEIKQNMKESETLKDSYCDKLIKNMDEYRKMINSNEA